MVGLVLVSHSFEVAEGAARLARQMGGADVLLETAGGLAGEDHEIGTDAVLVMEAIDRAWSPDGVLVLMDLGSAVLSAEMALDLLPDDRRAGVQLCDAPLVEGAVAAAVAARMGRPLAEVAEEARGGLASKRSHLGTDGDAEGPGAAAAGPVAVREGARTITATVTNAHGLHARPAARLVQTAGGFDAEITVRNATTGKGPVKATSLNAVATLGVTWGQTIEIAASGTAADAALDALAALAARAFDEAGEVEEAAPVAAVADDRPVPEGAVRGLPASPGIAIGPLRRLHAQELTIPETTSADPDRELAALTAALEATARDLEAQREDVASRAGAAESEIFGAHLLFLRDDALLDPARDAVRAGRSAAAAWWAAVEAVASEWEQLDDPYLRARIEDLRSVGRQVLARILGSPLRPARLDEPGILAVTDLSPAEAAALDPAVVQGLAVSGGGPTAHAAVLARALAIPAVVGLGEVMREVAEGTIVVLDGRTGLVEVDPAPRRLEEVAAERQRERADDLAARAVAHEPARTRDGTPIEVAANIGLPREAGAAVSAGADGVGLFRTEFLFLDRAEIPGEDEQETAYRAAAEALGGRPLTVRTLDAGADKPLAALAQPAEDNPFLGVRGIRLGLARPELLAAQLRALLRVGADHPIRVLFPMIATREELRAAVAALEDAAAGLGLDPASVEVGVMVEVPSAALIASALAAECRFLSIGTNDLTQYTLAADRGNEHVAGIADPLHPAVLSLIARTVEGARAHGRWVGVCGELAGDPAATSVLLGLGVTELSMSAPAIAGVKAAVRAADLEAARALADAALGASTAAEVRALLRPA